MRRLSVPREHGAWLTLAGAIIGGVWLAPDRLTAIGFALALGAAFFVRAQIEKEHPAPWDAAARTVCALAALAGALVAGRLHQGIGAAAAGLGFCIVGASWLARRMRRHRSAWFEAAGMAALGATAGVIALSGRASWSAALAIGLVLGTHAAVSVPLVRSDLRPRERRLEGQAMLVGSAALIAAALALWLAGTPVAALGLLPRAIDLVARHLTHFRWTRAAAVGIRETVELTGALTLLLLVAF